MILELARYPDGPPRFVVFEIWESRAQQEAFMNDRLGPALAEAGAPQPSGTEPRARRWRARRPSPPMRESIYLVIRRPLRSRAARRPRLNKDEVAIRINLVFPDTWGKVLPDQVTVTVPDFAPSAVVTKTSDDYVAEIRARQRSTPEGGPELAAPLTGPEVPVDPLVPHKDVLE